MTTIKEILSKIKCKKCGNDDVSKFVLYFVMDAGITNKYVGCEVCDEAFEVGKPSDYFLEPHVNTAG